MAGREIRRIKRRKARGQNRTGLKLGRETIKSLSEEETSRLLAHIHKTIVKGGSGKTRGAKKHYRSVNRTIKLLQRDEFYHLQRRIVFKESKLLDCFLPARASRWLEGDERDSRENHVNLESFSFIDAPLDTFKGFTDIALSEATTLNTFLNFEDRHCLDIAPYMVLALMRNDMSPVIRGGRIRNYVYDVFNAVDLLQKLKIRPMKFRSAGRVIPFKMRSRRGKGTSTDDNSAFSATTEEKVAEQFSDTFNDWLGQLTPAFELSEIAYIQISTLFGELLDNAKRHSDVQNLDGDWHIAGFMEMVAGPDIFNPREGAIYNCHFAIVSLGNTVFESLKTAPKSIQDSIANYCDRIQSLSPKRWNQELLWAVCAIQDGISRIPPDNKGTKNGFGIMRSLLALMNTFNHAQEVENKAKMTIISGKSCIMIKYPYDNFSESDGKWRLAFNKDNDIDKPPDADHVVELPTHFPGTLITVRFVMDGGHLVELTNGS